MLLRQGHYFTAAAGQTAPISTHQPPICHSSQKLPENTKDSRTRVLPVERERERERWTMGEKGRDRKSSCLSGRPAVREKELAASRSQHFPLGNSHQNIGWLEKADITFL